MTPDFLTYFPLLHTSWLSKHIANHPHEIMKVVAASAGNHAQGVAYAAKRYGA